MKGAKNLNKGTTGARSKQSATSDLSVFWPLNEITSDVRLHRSRKDSSIHCLLCRLYHHPVISDFEITLTRRKKCVELIVVPHEFYSSTEPMSPPFESLNEVKVDSYT